MNATVLPRAVQAIGDAAEKAAVDAGMRGGQPGQPVTEPTVKVVPDPAAKVDPEDYKERFSRYKTTTDQTIQDLRQTLAASQQIVTNLQTQVNDLTAKIGAASQAPVETAKPVVTADLSDDAAYKRWFDGLPQNIRDDYEESYLRDQYVIQQTAAPTAQENPEIAEMKSQLDAIKQDQVKTAGQLYEEAMDAAYPDDLWINMASGPEWQAFCGVTPAFSNQTYGQIVKQASDSHKAATVISVLKQYEQHKLTLNNGGQPEVINPLAGQLTPDNGGAGGGGDPIDQINANTETFTVSQINEFYKDIATTKKYTPEQAADIEQSIKAAQAAGKIING